MARKIPAGVSPRGSGGRTPLPPLVHGRVRLLILSHLIRSPRAHPFTSLRKTLQLTDGSLSAQLAKLEKGELVVITKTIEGKRPLTLVRVTPKGRRVFRQYVEDLKTIVPGLED